MKPRVRKFRIRRDEAPRPDHDTEPQGTPETGADAPATDTGATGDETPDVGLSARQLRLARRTAQKHGLSPASDFDAVRQLRQRGIDPFQRATIVELVAKSGGAGEGSQADESAQLPQIRPDEERSLPSTELSPAERRAREITGIQRDIAKRRRRKLALLVSRLVAFVILPTLLVGYYYAAVATPMYATKSAFLILSADGGGSGGGGGALGGLLPSQFATGQDAIATQEYLESKDAMLRLDGDAGFRDHFSQSWIDPLQRLDPQASTEDAYALYSKYVKIGYDPTEGVIRMEVSTADPQVSAEFSRRLIAYAEERVDALSREKRNDAVQTATESLEQAKQQRREAQAQLVALQEGSILDPEGEIAGIRSLINSVELQLQEKQLNLSLQKNNPRPNTARVEALQSEIDVLRAELERQKARLTEATEGEQSLASKTAAIQMAQADLATADLVLQSALEAKRQSQIEANKQVRYLTVSVRPVASQDPSYPKAFENTLLAFLIFSGIYLMISLTASILREQVSS
jgi:capsular polysaccharide transport system permease protein